MAKSKVPHLVKLDWSEIRERAPHVHEDMIEETLRHSRKTLKMFDLLKTTKRLSRIRDLMVARIPTTVPHVQVKEEREVVDM